MKPDEPDRSESESSEGKVPRKAPYRPQAHFISFIYSIRGLKQFMVREHNARVHLIVTSGAFLAGYLVDIDADGWRWLILAAALVWITEILNTAVEELGDRVSPEFDPVVGRAKDLAAAAVLIAILASVIIGGTVLAPYVLDAL